MWWKANRPCLVLLLAALLRPASPTFLEVAKISSVIVKQIWELWQWTGEELKAEGGPGLPFSGGGERLPSRIRELSARLSLQDQMNRYSDGLLYNHLLDLPTTFKYHLQVYSLLDSIFTIERADNTFRDYLEVGLKNINQTGKAFIEDYTLFDFLESVISHKPQSVRSNMDKLHQMIIVDETRSFFNTLGLFDSFLKYFKEAEDQICESQMSPQQLLYNLYAILQMSQLKAYTMIQFSWLLLRLYNKGNFTSEADLMRQNYLDRMSQQALSVKEAMNETDSVLWRCDPRNHEEGKTYTQVTKVLQGFLVNEVDLNKDGTCREDCPFYKYTKQFSCYKENFCQKQPRCNGNIVGCQFVDSDMWVCQSPSSSTRRYDWIEYENGRTLGTKQHCHRPVTKVDSWWRWLFWHCSFCYCFCDDPRDIKSDRYFNLRPSVSDKRKNRVITGIRFTKVNRVIHLQIQEGELLPMGGINASTVEWQPVDAYSIDDEGVTVGTDYHMLTWESRAIDLDDLKLPHNSVLTGIKLRRVGGHLNLEIQGSEFNFTEGKLLQAGEKSYWISNDKTDVSPDNPRTHLKLKNPDVPTKSTGPSVPDSRSVQFIEFTSSDLDLDAGQTTVPFIDAQDVAPNPPTPLSGAGLYHKGRKYSGGFIAPRVFTFDFSLHIKDHFPEINEADS